MCPRPAATATGLCEMVHILAPHRSASMGNPAAPPFNARTPAVSSAATRDLVDLVGGVVELDVGNRPCRRTDVLPVHFEDEADERLCRGEEAHDLGMLIGEFRPPDLDETNIIGSRVEAQTPKPLGLECERRR
jgi:hypothetical protein